MEYRNISLEIKLVKEDIEFAKGKQDRHNENGNAEEKEKYKKAGWIVSCLEEELAEKVKWKEGMRRY